MNTPTVGETTTAMKETMALLRPPLGPVDGGYVDLLEPDDVLTPHRTQRMFRTRIVPRVYERFSRPLASRIFFGLRGPRADDERQIVMGMLEIEPGDRVLDVGCGPGNYTRCFAEAAGDGMAVGLDASSEMLAAAVERGGSGVAYVRGDGADLPFDDGVFDAVGCVGVLHLVEDPIGALDEMARVLAPGGRMMVATTWSRGAGPRPRFFGGHVFGDAQMRYLLGQRGLVEVRQRALGISQFVSARKPEA